MLKAKMFQLRMSPEQTADLAGRAEEAGVSVAAFARSLLFPTEGQVTTAAKIATPKRKPGKLCPACAKAGRARWNCPTCRPARVGAA